MVKTLATQAHENQVISLMSLLNEKYYKPDFFHIFKVP